MNRRDRRKAARAATDTRSTMRAFLTRPLIDPASIPLEVLRHLDQFLSTEEARTNHRGNAVFRIGEREFPWSFVRTALALIEDEPEVLVGLVSADAMRLDAPTVRLALNYCRATPGAPGCELLDAAGVAMLEALDKEGRPS